MTKTKTTGCRIAPFLMTLTTVLAILGNATIFLRIIQQKNTRFHSVFLSVCGSLHKKVRQNNCYKAFVRLFLHKNFMISPMLFQRLQPLIEPGGHNTQDHNA